MDNSYDGQSVNYCADIKELKRSLQSKNHMHYSFPVSEVEVLEVTMELTQAELVKIRDGKVA
jgi:hypothetical protein